MKFLSKNKYLFLLVIFFVLCFVTDASAASEIFGKVRSVIVKALRDLKGIIFIVGGFGLIAFSFAAVFGKISFKHLATISFSLMLVSSISLFIQYFSGHDAIVGELGYGDFLHAKGK